ncbi:hypothetical protein T492DRAFT_847437 [Pavlovales sp. CCMP2436]|nr:hypothetical protein T492DRAFT_847437 [Pavlovales sp. CCMP2436]
MNGSKFALHVPIHKVRPLPAPPLADGGDAAWLARLRVDGTQPVEYRDATSGQWRLSTIIGVRHSGYRPPAALPGAFTIGTAKKGLDGREWEVTLSEKRGAKLSWVPKAEPEWLPPKAGDADAGSELRPAFAWELRTCALELASGFGDVEARRRGLEDYWHKRAAAEAKLAHKTARTGRADAAKAAKAEARLQL